MSAADPRVLDWLVGGLAPADRAAFEAELADDAELRAAVAGARAAMVALAEALPPVPPAPALRARVLASVEAAAWERQAERVAALFDLPVRAVIDTFRSACAPSGWVDGPVPGVRLFHLAGGPATAGADVGLVRVAPGVAFPRHRHLGEERLVVLSGALLDSAGAVQAPGTSVCNPPGSEHAFVADPDADEAVFAVVLRGGVALVG